MNKISTKLLFVIMAAVAILSVISFFQINSYWADQHHFNAAWEGIGAALAVVTVALLRVIASRSSGKNGSDD